MRHRLTVIALVAALLTGAGCGLLRGGDDAATGTDRGDRAGGRWAEPESAAPAEPAEPPRVGPNAVLQPSFDTTEGQVDAGTAFVLSFQGAHLLVTAYHLFGPSGGMSRAIPAAELPDVVRSVTATSADDPSVAVRSDRLLDIPGASAFIPSEGDTPIDVRPDVAAFRLDGPGGAHVLTLADEPVRDGDRVYLLARVRGSDERLHPATVSGAGDTFVSYRFDDPVELRGSSGGPVLNADGEVVGINVAGGDSDGKTFGLCGPTGPLREKLAAGLN